MARVIGTIAFLLALAPRAGAAEPSVKVDILVIEAERVSGDFDPRISKLKAKLEQAGYKSAKVIDELSHHQIDIGSRVSLQMPSRKQTLSVRVLELTKDQKIKLQVAI